MTWQWRRAEDFRRRAEAGLAEVRLRQQQAEEALRQERKDIQALIPFVNDRLGGFLSHRPEDEIDYRGDREAFRRLVLQRWRRAPRKFRRDPSYRRHLAQRALTMATLVELAADPAEALEAYDEAEGYYADLVRARPRRPRSPGRPGPMPGR